MVKKIIFTATILLSSSSAFALFTNGGFETGDLSGWTLDYGLVTPGYGKSISWGFPIGVTPGVWAAGDSMGGYSGNPYSGVYSARINDIDGKYNATKISQTDTISASDIASGARLYVHWGAVLNNPIYHVINAPAPNMNANPFFGIDVRIGGGVVGTFYADAETKQGGGWTNLTGDNWYKHDTWSFDLSTYTEGTAVTIEMYVADCGLGVHGGFALLDGIGTSYSPETLVPAPGAIVLCLLGARIVSWAKRRRVI